MMTSERRLFRPWPVVAGAMQTGIPRVAGITALNNVRNWRSMEELGLTRKLAHDSDQPALPAGHRLSRHPTRRIARPA